MNNYPINPATSLKLMEIALDLQGIQSDTLFTRMIFGALKTGRVAGIVKEIYYQSKDNRDAVSDIVGEKTLLKIEKLFV